MLPNGTLHLLLCHHGCSATWPQAGGRTVAHHSVMTIYILAHVPTNGTSRHLRALHAWSQMHSYFPDGILWVYLLVAVITIATLVYGLSMSWCVECISVHAIKFTALDIKRETAHKKAEPPIDPEKTQSTPSSLALQPSPV